MKISFVLTLFPFALLLSCQPPNNSNPSAKELIKSHEIKQVSTALILQKATQVGDSIAADIRLQIAGNSDTLDSAFCDAQRIPILESISSQYGVNIQRIRHDFSDLILLEKELLIAYQYNFDNELKMYSSVQKIDKQYVLYISPIQKTDSFYVLCQGDNLNEFLGLWSIKIPVKKLVDVL